MLSLVRVAARVRITAVLLTALLVAAGTGLPSPEPSQAARLAKPRVRVAFRSPAKSHVVGLRPGQPIDVPVTLPANGTVFVPLLNA